MSKFCYYCHLIAGCFDINTSPNSIPDRLLSYLETKTYDIATQTLKEKTLDYYLNKICEDIIYIPIAFCVFLQTFPISLFFQTIANTQNIYNLLTSQNKNYNSLKGNQEKIKKREKTISIKSYNICAPAAGEFAQKLFGGVFNISRRIKDIIKDLKKDPCDILLFQEAHSIRVINELYRNLKEEYPYFYVNIGARTLLPLSLEQNSGLFIASKHEIKNIEFFSFDKKCFPLKLLNGNGSQSFVNKGFCKFTLKNSNTCIINTHLPPSSNHIKNIKKKLKKILSTSNYKQKEIKKYFEEEIKKIKKEQEKRKKAIDMIKKKISNYNNVIIAGDFNINPKQYFENHPYLKKLQKIKINNTLIKNFPEFQDFKNILSNELKKNFPNVAKQLNNKDDIGTAATEVLKKAIKKELDIIEKRYLKKYPLEHIDYILLKKRNKDLGFTNIAKVKKEKEILYREMKSDHFPINARVRKTQIRC